MLDFLKPRPMDLNFAGHLEPEEGINTPEEFRQELERWAEKNRKTLEIRTLSMEPRITLEGKDYVCRLASPELSRQSLLRHTPLSGCSKGGAWLGYRWIYLYEE